MFSLNLNYNTPQYGAAAQWNGNIAEQVYNAAISGSQHVNYTYDNLNRLTSGNSTTGFSETGISYDALGNIQGLSRSNYGSLAYGYNGNQLTAVSGYISRSYGYDANGNATSDGQGNGITYNFLNLPQSIPNKSLTYTYDAGGSKLKKVSGGTTTDYINGIQYTNGAIDFIQTEEGRAINSAGNYKYEYTLTDHLGNNRVTFDQTNGKVGEDDYYPFGLNIHRQQNAGNKYLYNKKELQEELNQYDYGARFYDPVIARWTAVDKESEKYESYTPYAYVLNRPTVAIDPDGKRIYFIGGANNDQDGWNYIQRWQQTFAKNGINDFHRMNESNGKYHDIMFTNNYRNSATEPVIVSAGRFAASTGETRPVQNETIDKTVADYKKDLQDHPLKEGEQFNMVGYSYGSVLQAQAAIKLANSGQVIDNLVLIGSPISDKSDLYNDLTSNKNIKNVIRYDIKGDAISNPQGVYDFLIKGGLIQGGGQGDKAHHFDAARPGAQANQLMDTIVKWLQQHGVKN